MKSGDKLRVETLRFLVAAIKKYEIDTYPPGSTNKLSEDDVLKILRKQVKNHEESIAAFQKGNRQDLVDKEVAEMEILKSYLPEDLGDKQLVKIVQSVIGRGMTNFGQVMGVVMKEVGGRAGGERVVKIVKDQLQK